MLALLPLTAGVHVAAQTKASSKKTTAKKTVAKKAPSKTSSKSGTKSTTARKGKKAAPRQPAVTWRNRQAVPSADRYRDIQAALATKGYLRQEDVTGQWNQASVDALKRFQSEQSLEPNGKVNSLSLIALGLGPKYEARAALPPPPNPPVQ